MRPVHARDLAEPFAATIPAAATAAQAAEAMQAAGARHLAVRRGSARAGVLSDLALLSFEDRYDRSRRLPDPAALPPEAPDAGALAVQPRVTARPTAPLGPLLLRLAEAIDEFALVQGDHPDEDGLVTESRAVAVASGWLDGAPTVARFASPRLIALPSSAWRADGRAALLAAGVRHLLLVDGGAVTGILSLRDLTRSGWPDGVPVAEDRHRGPRLAALTTRRPIVIDPDLPLRAAALMMNDLGVGCLPIVDRGAPVGVVTRTDVVRALAEAL